MFKWSPFCIYLFLNVCAGSKDGKYVLKIMSSEESKDEPGFQVIHSFQKYLRQHGFINAPPLQNVHGDDLRLEIFSRVQSAGNKLQQFTHI